MSFIALLNLQLIGNIVVAPPRRSRRGRRLAAPTAIWRYVFLTVVGILSQAARVKIYVPVIIHSLMMQTSVIFGLCKLRLKRFVRALGHGANTLHGDYSSMQGGDIYDIRILSWQEALGIELNKPLINRPVVFGSVIDYHERHCPNCRGTHPAGMTLCVGPHSKIINKELHHAIFNETAEFAIIWDRLRGPVVMAIGQALCNLDFDYARLRIILLRIERLVLNGLDGGLPQRRYFLPCAYRVER